MIWFEEEIHCQDQPEESIIILSGIYNTPGVSPHIPTIIIRLKVDTNTTELNSTLAIIVLFQKSPTMLQQEEPASEDVLAKYQSKILKFKEKIERTVYKTVLSMAIKDL